MSRSEGLVQRRIVANNQTSDKSSISNNINESNELEGETSVTNHDIDHDVDSKDTRLTLMEEVLLLGLKDKEVNY